jgi:hypothetical protein
MEIIGLPIPSSLRSFYFGKDGVMIKDGLQSYTMAWQARDNFLVHLGTREVSNHVPPEAPSSSIG